MPIRLTHPKYQAHRGVVVIIAPRDTETEPQILYLSAKTYGKQSVAGDIMEAPAAMADLESFI